MCFSDAIRPTVFRESRRTARKAHACCECHMPILPGERYQEVFGVWDGDAQTHRTCEVCEWFRERVADSERQVGCRGAESYPAFGWLYEELAEGHAESIGLVDLDGWHDREAARMARRTAGD